MTSCVEGDSVNPRIDKDWLQKIFRISEDDSKLCVSSYELGNMGGKGENYLSWMCRVQANVLRSGNKPDQISIFVKELPVGKALWETMAKSSAFPNEIKVYSQVLPRYHDILNNIRPGTNAHFAARLIYSENDMHVLAVQDLTSEGFKMAERRQGLALTHCSLVMRALARYHAVSVSLHDEDPCLIESFKENFVTEETSTAVIKKIYESSIGAVADLVQSWPVVGERTAGKLRKLSVSSHDVVKRQLLPAGSRLNVLTHGDLWVNNLLFRYDDISGAVRDVRFVDFQMTTFASFAIDLQHFIHTSPSDDVRANHTDDLLMAYHRELSSTLELLGQGHRVICFEELMEEYEKKGQYGLIMSLVALPIIIGNPEDAEDLDQILSESFLTQKMYNRANNKQYICVLKRILPEYEAKGYV
ncbi:uncharacterized protein LOC134531422 [Bacillus rossius redtenbacheri]|uniref:uncharacterized protein LOC134531422 n=1 Tax=Bacillus rossius redtenbacheri TaxID=93214 RepID=UPI002FDE52A4